jgi:hypothetical protein
MLRKDWGKLPGSISKQISSQLIDAEWIFGATGQKKGSAGCREDGGVQRCSLMYTHCMAVLGLRRRQHRLAARLLALVLLAGVFVLTSTPVCGSALDIDPIACCEHHACGQSPKSCPGRKTPSTVSWRMLLDVGGSL